MKLIVVRGETPGNAFEIQEGGNLIGRWDPDTAAFPEIDLEKEDPEAKVSRKHAVIERNGQRVTLRDLGSLNGTFVNRQRILGDQEPVELNDGDEVIIGKTILKFCL